MVLGFLSKNKFSSQNETRCSWTGFPIMVKQPTERRRLAAPRPGGRAAPRVPRLWPRTLAYPTTAAAPAPAPGTCLAGRSCAASPGFFSLPLLPVSPVGVRLALRVLREGLFRPRGSQIWSPKPLPSVVYRVQACLMKVWDCRVPQALGGALTPKFWRSLLTRPARGAQGRTSCGHSLFSPECRAAGGGHLASANQC